MHTNRFTRVGFILAAAGSAVGLGNIWKFPYITGDNGGGVFVLVYLLTIAVIGISVFLAESIIGYSTNKNSVSAFEELSPTKYKKTLKFGGFSFLTALMILTFYTVVIGWILQYIVISITHLPTSIKEAESVFMGLLTQDIASQILYYIVAFGIIVYTVLKGIKKGIEKINKILMPTLIAILAIMLAYSITLSGFGSAVSFMFAPDFSKFSSDSVIVAVGHAFFTLSIGMAVILTYSASIEKNTNIVKSAVLVAILDTLIAIVAGLVVFTFLFTNGHEAGKGAGLVFITLPAVFYEMGGAGNILAIAFFIALAFAGITSAISILEPGVQYLEQRMHMKRKKATLLLSGVIFVLGLIALLSNTERFSEILTIGSKNVFDWADYITANILLPLGGIVTALFVGYIMDKEKVQHIMLQHMSVGVYKLWLFCLRIVAPLGVFVVMLYELGLFGN